MRARLGLELKLLWRVSGAVNRHIHLDALSKIVMLMKAEQTLRHLPAAPSTGAVFMVAHGYSCVSCILHGRYGARSPSPEAERDRETSRHVNGGTSRSMGY